VSKFRWLTFGAVGGGFIVLYGVLLAMVWRASKTITQQQAVNEEHATRQCSLWKFAGISRASGWAVRYRSAGL